jgi:hypothetical protein
MLKAITRTVGVFGTILAAGYVAKRYFGWDSDSLVNQAKDKLSDFTGQAKNFQPPSKGNAKSSAI